MYLQSLQNHDHPPFARALLVTQLLQDYMDETSQGISRALTLCHHISALPSHSLLSDPVRVYGVPAIMNIMRSISWFVHCPKAG